MFKQSHILQQATTSTSKAPAAQFRRGKAGYEVLRVNLRIMSTYQAPRFSQCYQVAIYIDIYIYICNGIYLGIC